MKKRFGAGKLDIRESNSIENRVADHHHSNASNGTTNFAANYVSMPNLQQKTKQLVLTPYNDQDAVEEVKKQQQFAQVKFKQAGEQRTTNAHGT